MSLRDGEIVTEISKVHSSEALGGSLLLLVTGIMEIHYSIRRRFVQTFFLSPQHGGLYAMNDIFMYLNNETPPFMFQNPLEAGKNIIFSKGSYFVVKADILSAT